VRGAHVVRAGAELAALACGFASLCEGAALDLSWTRDPFDRLIAAHARLRGWRLATADETLLNGLGPRHTIQL